MKILSIGNDDNLFKNNSSVSRRVIEYGNMVDSYAVIVPDKNYKKIKLSEKVSIYGSGGSNKIFKLINVYRVAKKLLKQEKFDVITVQDQYYLAWLSLFLARKFKVGLELQIHGFEKYSDLRKIIADFVIPRANAIRCVSQRLKKQLIEKFSAEGEKITVVPIFSNLKSKISNLKSDETGNAKFVFLTVGRLALVKNIGLQIKAMAEICQKSKVKSQKIELWIVGDGILSQKLKVESQNLGIENNVKFLGWQDNLEKFYSQADVFLLTSDYEGWGVAVVEAASYGLPIIMTDVGCAGELIENEKSGLVIPINDRVKLQEAMIRFINDANLRRKLAEGALSAIKNLPNKEETLALYKKSWKKTLVHLEKKILIITQKVDINDDVLGFFHRWIEEFAKYCEKVTVICLQKGEYNLPQNVRVFSLGKEGGVSKIKYTWRFYKHIWRERKNYDFVFVHMNPEYAILGGLIWNFWKKKMALWYTHKKVNLKLRLAEKLVDRIFTASRESFRLPSGKVEITGHGIDVEKFQIPSTKSQINIKIPNSKFQIITAGRIAEIKNLHLLVEAAEILKNEGFNFNIKIAGAPILESDKKYFEKLKEKIKEKKLDGIIEFVGSIPNKDIASFYQNGDLFVNFSDTGSLDKAILEAMACGLRILTVNEAFKDILKEENITDKNPENIANKIISLAKNEKDYSLVEFVAKNHNLDNLVIKIIQYFRNER